MQKEKKTRVCVVGSGLAGLTAAYLLSHDVQQRYNVEIFETGPSPSLDAASMTVSLRDASSTLTSHRLDVPMRAFAGGFYKNLLSLYTHLGIPYRRKNFLYTFSTSTSTYHLHPSNLHRFPPNPPGVPWFTHILQLALLYVTYTYFTLCVFYIPPKTAPGESLKSYLRRIHLSERITREYLLPLFSAVSTCPHQALLEFPAADIVAYRRAVYAQPHYIVTGGVGKVQKRLLEGVPIYFNRRVEAVEGGKEGITVRWTDIDSAMVGLEKKFDRVILAVNPQVVGKIYRPLRKQMERIPCLDVDVVLHTDGSLLQDLFPRKMAGEKGKGRSANVVAAERLLGGTGADLIHLNTARSGKGGAVQTQASHLHAPGVLITTQPHREIPPDKFLGATRFTRVLRTCESRDVVRDLVAGDGEGGVWVVGGWAWDGMVLLEGCVVSAVRVARDFGVEVPW